MAANIDVSKLINDEQSSGFIGKLVFITFLLVVADGFDISAIGFAVPGIVRGLGITDMSMIGPMIAASLFGILVGAPIFGIIGDKYGRKQAIFWACLLFGVFTWATAWASSVQQISILRFIAGLGIGGLLPNVIALMAELVPARYRAAMIVLSFTGVALGGALPGLIAATLVGSYGWQIIFHIGGILPIIIAFMCLTMLPESVKFLVLKNKGTAAITSVLRQIGINKDFGADAQFVVADEAAPQGAAIGELFRGALGTITPLLWLLFIANLMGYFFLLSWTPTVLQAAKIDPSKAALAGVLLQFGGVVAGLVMFWFRLLEKYGLAIVAVLFALAVPTVAGIGYAASAQAEPLVFALQFLAGICCLGIQFSINAMSGIVYPTSARSMGSGLCLGVGRLGSVVGPIVGGALIASQLAIGTLYSYAAIPFAIGCVATLVLMRFYKKPVMG